MEKKKEIVLYYVTHVGKGALGPVFRKELKKADLVYLEASKGASPRTLEVYSRIAQGDRRVHRAFLDTARKAYENTGNLGMLFDVEMVNALLGSKKKIIFEEPPASAKGGEPTDATARMRQKAAMVRDRALEDSRKIADWMREKDRVLMVRGKGHYMTGDALKRALAERGIAVPIREISPPVRRSEMGTPYHIGAGPMARLKGVLGRRITKGDLARVRVTTLLTKYLTARGWGINDIEPHLGHLVREVRLTEGEIERLEGNPRGIPEFFRRKGVDVEKPWWAHEKDILKKKPGLKKR